jgi:hypothetical protein
MTLLLSGRSVVQHVKEGSSPESRPALYGRLNQTRYLSCLLFQRHLLTILISSKANNDMIHKQDAPRKCCRTEDISASLWIVIHNARDPNPFGHLRAVRAQHTTVIMLDNELFP